MPIGHRLRRRFERGHLARPGGGGQMRLGRARESGTRPPSAAREPRPALQLDQRIGTGEDAGDVGPRLGVEEQGALARRDQFRRDLADEAGRLDQRGLVRRKGARQQFADRRRHRARRSAGQPREVAQDPRLAHRQHPVELAQQPRHQGRADVADVEDPARVLPRIVRQRRGDLGQRAGLGVARRLEHAVVEETRRAIGLGSHRRSAGRGRWPGRAPGPASAHPERWLGGRSAGHAAP